MKGYIIAAAAATGRRGGRSLVPRPWTLLILAKD